MYKILRAFLFLFDPEKVHYFSMDVLRRLCKVPVFKTLLASRYTPPVNSFSIFGLRFRNCVGLGAGFDKNANYLTELEALGFGFIEIGTVTPLPQNGNEKPRLFRLPKAGALINRMGFNNDGADVISTRLKTWRTKETKLIVGGNIGKNKLTLNEDAWKDYKTCFEKLHPYVDYFVVNVSSPNTPGLRELQEKEALKKILTTVQEMNLKLSVPPRPILLKISPDLTTEQVNDVVDLALEIKLDGFVAANTTTDRGSLDDASQLKAANAGAGGLSGKPLAIRSSEIIQQIFERTNGAIPIIASGGIFNSGDAMKKLTEGASLLQVWTGFIYEGPIIVKNICSTIPGS